MGRFSAPADDGHAAARIRSSGLLASGGDGAGERHLRRRPRPTNLPGRRVADDGCHRPKAGQVRRPHDPVHAGTEASGRCAGRDAPRSVGLRTGFRVRGYRKPSAGSTGVPVSHRQHQQVDNLRGRLSAPVEQGKLKLSDKVFSVVRPGTAGQERRRPTPREYHICQCLQHTAGWDRLKGFDRWGRKRRRTRRRLWESQLPVRQDIIRFGLGNRSISTPVPLRVLELRLLRAGSCH